MSVHRREFLKATGVAAAITVRQHPRFASPGKSREARAVRSTLTAIDFRAITARALDTAKRAGAQYADVRITYERYREFLQLFEREELGIGIRTLVDGSWGFASAPYLESDVVERTAKEAVAQARVNALSGRGNVALSAIPIVADGKWTGPVVLDPFEVPVEEVRDWARGIQESLIVDLSRTYRKSSISLGWAGIATTKTEKVLATTEGTYTHQTFYRTTADLRISYNGIDDNVRCFGSGIGGWELIVKAPVVETAHKTIEELMHRVQLPQKAVDVGRRDVVFDAVSMASLVGQTIGAATQIDRALGYEANAGGTSYLGPDPLRYLGTEIGASFLTVRGNRSMRDGLATTQWDDEGAVPDDFSIVENGVLVDYQTTREQAPWLESWYRQRGRPVRTHGCAASASALAITVQQPPNLVMAPGHGDVGFDDLVATMDNGIAAQGMSATTDFQHLNGLGLGTFFEVRAGRRVAVLRNAGIRFRAPELWKGLQVIGGPRSVDTSIPAGSTKGEPAQRAEFSISAVPGIVKNLALIDAVRKA